MTTPLQPIEIVSFPVGRKVIRARPTSSGLTCASSTPSTEPRCSRASVERADRARRHPVLFGLPDDGDGPMLAA